jgi:hypothetical protein
MRWVVLTYRVPQEPSRHRVGLWRELRRAGAVPLQQGTWALPVHARTSRTIERVDGLVARGEGQLFVFDADARDERMAADLEAAFIAGREDEWHEFLRECDKFDQEIDKEIRIRKFTAAELDEEEQNLERLRRWHEELRTRDVLGAPSAAEAEIRLKSCGERLDAFAKLVFEEGGS